MSEYPGPMGWIVGVAAFFGCWGYAVATYGWFLGIGLGWLPSLFIAVIAGVAWPLIAIALIVGGGLIFIFG